MQHVVQHACIVIFALYVASNCVPNVEGIRIPRLVYRRRAFIIRCCGFYSCYANAREPLTFTSCTTTGETPTAEQITTDTTLTESPSSASNLVTSSLLTSTTPPSIALTTAPAIALTTAPNVPTTTVITTTLTAPPIVSSTIAQTTTAAAQSTLTSAAITTVGVTTVGVTTTGVTATAVTTTAVTTTAVTTTAVTTTTSTATTSTTTSTTTACPYSLCVTADCNSNIAAKDAAISAVPATTLYPGLLALTYLNGQYYYIEKTKKMNWFDALVFCRTNGMDLVQIESQAEQDAMNTELTKLSISGEWVYTSGNKIGPVCPYTWVDDSELTYQNWLAGEPSQSNAENCLIIKNKKWEDLYCTATAYFICEPPAGATITTTTPCPYSKCLTGECNGNIAAKAAAISSVPATTLYPGNLALSYLNGTYYYIEKSKTLNYFDALVFCRTNGMELTNIDSQEEQDAINAELTKLGIVGNWVYTSGNKIGPICPFTWLDGSELIYKNWDTNEPSQSTSENCLIIFNKKWVDLFCSAGAYFICEAPANAAITTTTPCPYFNCTSGQCNQDVLDREAAIKAVPATTLYPATLPLTFLNGQYYYFEKTRAITWFAALTFCRTNGMDLVKIESQAEQDAINGELTKLGTIVNWVFTSGNKIGPKCPYTWEDGSPLAYSNWQSGEPAQSTSENCLITWNSKWWDLPCAFGTYFICEQLPGQTITTTVASG